MPKDPGLDVVLTIGAFGLEDLLDMVFFLGGQVLDRGPRWEP